MGYVAIHNNGSSFDLDMATRDVTDYSVLQRINQTLSSEHIPVVVWQVDKEERDIPPVIRITNE